MCLCVVCESHRFCEFGVVVRHRAHNLTGKLLLFTWRNRGCVFRPCSYSELPVGVDRLCALVVVLARRRQYCTHFGASHLAERVRIVAECLSGNQPVSCQLRRVLIDLVEARHCEGAESSAKSEHQSEAGE